MTALRIICFFALAACSEEVTRVELTVHGDPAWQLDNYEVRVGDRIASTEIHDELELLVPDAMAGTSTTIVVRGMKGIGQLAFGTTTVVPALHSTVHGEVTLVEMQCTDACEVGTTACVTDGTLPCEHQIDGCTDWGAVTACPSEAPYCSNGACSATCSDECMPDQTKCDGAAFVRTCGQFDNDACHDWSAPNACGGSQTCSDGACTGTCDAAMCTTAPAPTCVGANTLRTFQGPGTCGSGGGCEYAHSDLNCPDGCVNGACISITAGRSHSCAVMSNGAAQCWGANDHGQLNEPTGTFTQVRAGWDHTCALRTNGTIACWGASDHDQLQNIPTGTFVSLAADGWETCAIRPNGSAVCWGYNPPTPLNQPFVMIDAGSSHMCGVTTSGAVKCWGYEPTNGGQVTQTPTGGSWLVAGAGDSHSCAVESNGAITCWGSNDYGERTPPFGNFRTIAVGDDFSCALRTDNTIACWGYNGANQATPTQGTYHTVATGMRHACGVRTAGYISCWGSNYSGESQPP